MKKRTSSKLICLIFLCFNLEAGANKLSIVIDDLGYNFEKGRRAIDLSAKVTLAILPFAPEATRLSSYARKRGRETIIHLPMEAESAEGSTQERITLTSKMSPIQYKIILRAALKKLGTPTGLSNHMGSLLTQQYRPMLQIMSEMANNNLYFLDSKTINQSAALKAAQKTDIRYLSRDYFLDNLQTIENMEQVLKKAIKLSRKKGSAVVIAHPYNSSLSFLEDALRNLPKDIQLVYASHLAIRRPGKPDPQGN